MAGRSRAAINRITVQAQISGWDMSWSFGMATHADPRRIGDHYSEHASMKLHGSIRYPEVFKYPTL